MADVQLGRQRSPEQTDSVLGQCRERSDDGMPHAVYHDVRLRRDRQPATAEAGGRAG
jgi:hypothetical protein